MDHLPDLPSVVEHCHLIVVLARLSEEEKLSLRRHVNDRNLNKSNPLFAFCPDNQAQRRIEKECKDGCTGDIYELAGQAKALGWKCFLVFDALSKHQLNGTVSGEASSGAPEFVLVNIHSSCTRPEAAVDDRKGVVLGRVRTAEALYLTALPKRLVANGLLKPWSRGLDGRISSYDNAYQKGLVLFNPNAPILGPEKEEFFTNISKFQAIESAMSSSATPLPQEIKDVVNDIIDKDEEFGTYEYTDTPELQLEHLRDTQKQFAVCSFSAMTKEQISEIQEQLNEGLSQPRFILYPWKNTTPGTRKDWWKLYNRNRDVNIIFYKSLWDRERALLLMERPLSWPNSTMPLRAYKTLIEEAREQFHDPRSRMVGLNDRTRGEWMIDPSRRFFHDLPPYRPDSPTCASSHAVVFSLTSHLSDAEMKSIWQELKSAPNIGQLSPNESSEHYSINVWLNWDKQQDATPHDMWITLRNISSFRKRGHTHMICVDRQSIVDKTVLMVEKISEHYKDSDEYARSELQFTQTGAPLTPPPLPHTEDKGIKWARCRARDAIQIWSRICGGRYTVVPSYFHENLSGPVQGYIQPEYTGKFAGSDEHQADISWV